MSIIFTGGSGRLGTEMKKIVLDPIWKFPVHTELDILNISSSWKDESCELIIHAAAYTDVAGAEKNPDICNRINLDGTLNLIKFFPTVPFVYISSEYAWNPINVYSQSKAMAERIVLSHCYSCLIIRTLFKPRPYPYNRAFIDQFTQGDYLDVIAPRIVKKINDWDRKGKILEYVGTGRKTIYELAKQTVPDVKPVSVSVVKDVQLPKDYL